MADLAAPGACPACGEARPAGRMTPGAFVPDAVARMIQRKRPGWTRDRAVCDACLNDARADHMQRLLESEMGPLSPAEMQVIDSVRRQEFASVSPDTDTRRLQMPGERWSDRIAALVGNWRFSGAILALLTLWIGVNVLFRPFDPYPVIILAAISAALASLAALQGPIIMMSQRRQFQQDRIRAQNDYRVNLKTELEIRYLDEKLDRLMALQRERAAPMKDTEKQDE